MYRAIIIIPGTFSPPTRVPGCLMGMALLASSAFFLLIIIYLFLHILKKIDTGVSAMYESGEDYLEAILRLQLENGFVRSVDVANKLAVSRPSVSRAMGLLEKDGYIEFTLGNTIKLTEKGQLKAEDVYGRHKLLTSML